MWLKARVFVGLTTGILQVFPTVGSVTLMSVCITKKHMAPVLTVQRTCATLLSAACFLNAHTLTASALLVVIREAGHCEM